VVRRAVAGTALLVRPTNAGLVSRHEATDRCYVEGGTQCVTATASSRHPGAATKECDACACTQTGISNGYEQSKVGCGDHAQTGQFYCYTAVSSRLSRQYR
jgi:hypothetical protein